MFQIAPLRRGDIIKADRLLAVSALASVVFPYGTRDGTMAMFRAYFDESGTHADSPTIAVAGFLASDVQWAKFQSEWAKVLQKAEISFFHMTDWESRYEQFKGWDDEKRLALYTRLTNVIERRKVIPVAASVGVEDYRTTELRKMNRGVPENPYAFCALMCLQSIGDWADKVGYDGPIAYVFESGATHRGELDELYGRIMRNEEAKRRYRFISLTYADKKDFNPLQGADILAYESYKDIRNRYFEGGAREMRKSFKSLLGKIRSGGEHSYPYCRFFRKEHLLSSEPYRSLVERSS